GAAEGRGAGSGLEIVGRDRAAEGHVDVGVRVDAAGQDQQAGGVQDRVGLDLQTAADRGHDRVFDQEVGLVVVSSRDDAAVANEDAHRFPPLLPGNVRIGTLRVFPGSSATTLLFFASYEKR